MQTPLTLEQTQNRDGNYIMSTNTVCSHCGAPVYVSRYSSATSTLCLDCIQEREDELAERTALEDYAEDEQRQLIDSTDAPNSAVDTASLIIGVLLWAGIGIGAMVF